MTKEELAGALRALADQVAAGTVTFAGQGYVEMPLSGLAEFAGSTTPQAVSIARHKFDFYLDGRATTPLEPAWYGLYVANPERFAAVNHNLKKAWLAAILRDGGLEPENVSWYRKEFG